MAETGGGGERAPLGMASGVTPQPVDEETSAQLAQLNPHVGSNLPMCVPGEKAPLPSRACALRRATGRHSEGERAARGGLEGVLCRC